MSIASKARDLVSVLTAADFAVMPPAERRRFADLLRHIAKMAEPPPAQPKAGVLIDLGQATVRSELDPAAELTI